MNYLHADEYLQSSQSIRVDLGSQARVMLMDDSNYAAFRSGRAFRFYGGWAVRSPIVLSAPRAGHWHVVVDLDGRSGRVSANFTVIS